MWEWRGLKNKNFIEESIDFSSMLKLKNDMKFFVEKQKSNKIHKIEEKPNVIKVSEIAENITDQNENSHFFDLYSYKPQDDIEEIYNFTEDEMFKYLTSKLEFYNLKDIELTDATYVSEQFKKARSLPGKFQRARRSFLKLLGYHSLMECMEAGVGDYEIELLKRGISPENYNVHLKIPYEFGGDLDFSNLCLVKTFPTHEAIHKLIDLQISSGFLAKYRKIFLPYVKNKIYNPDKDVDSSYVDDEVFE